MDRISRVLLFVFLAVPAVRACSCMGYGPPCKEGVSPESAAVFLGTVQIIHQSGVDDLEVTLRVEESFKGSKTPAIMLHTNRSEAACGFPFLQGEQYVVYAYERDHKLYTSICQRTRPSKVAQEDLKFLRSLAGSTETSRIFGNYKRYTFDPEFKPKFQPSIMDHYRPPEEDYIAMAPMKGEKVVVSSLAGHTWSQTVDESGHFSFNGLPPGKYSLHASVPKNFILSDSLILGERAAEDGYFMVLSKGCAEVNFRAQPDGRISGKVLNPKGIGLDNVTVMAWHKGKEVNLYRFDIDAKTQEDGSFLLGPLPPGNYVLGAYVWTVRGFFPGCADEREQLTNKTLRFYENATVGEEAAPISLVLGQHREGVVLTIPYEEEQWKHVRQYCDQAP